MHDAEEKNAKASNEFVKKIRDLANIHNVLEGLRSGLGSTNPEEAFQAAETCAQYLNYKHPETNAESICNEVKEEHSNNFRIAEENKHAAFLTYREAIADVIDNLNEGNAFLASADGKNALQAAIDELASQDTRAVLTIHPVDTLETIVDKKRKGNFELFRELHRPEIRTQIERDLGISLVELTLKEQQHLLEFLSTKTKDTVRRWYALIQKHGVCAAKIFLAREESDRFVNAVLEHVNQLSYSEQHTFFLEYAYIIDATQKSAKDLAELAFQEGEARKDEAEKVRQKLLQAALPSENDLQGKVRGDILKARIHETGIFALLCKEAKASGKNAELQELADMLPEYKTGIELSAEEKNEMLEIARENWNAQMPDAANTVVNALTQSMQNPHTDFFILKRKNKILAFVRFDKKGDRTVYAGSLNVNSEARGSGIGEMALHAGIEHIAKHHRIIADVFPQLPVGTMYVEQFNCIIIGTETIRLQDGTIKKRLLLERDDEKYKAIKEIPANSEDIITVQNPDAIIDLVEKMRVRSMIASRYIANPNGSRTLHFIERDQHAA